MKKTALFRLVVLGASLACTASMFSSCDYWNEDWYKNQGSDPQSAGSSGSGGTFDTTTGSRREGKAIWNGFLVINHYDTASIWNWKRMSGREVLTANKTYTLHADMTWAPDLYSEGRIIYIDGIPRWYAGGETYEDFGPDDSPTEAQMKAAADEALALSGATILWSVEEDPDGVVASIVPSGDTRSCAVTIDYSKCKSSVSTSGHDRSKVTIKAKLTTTGLQRNEHGRDWVLGVTANRKYWVLDPYTEKNSTAFLSK